VVRLLPNGFQERKLRRLADISAKLFNEVNYERRQQFFHGGEWTSRERGANATRSIRKN